MSNSTARFSANRLAKEIHEANENVVRVYANGGSEFELKKAINLISETWMTLLQLNSHQEEYVREYGLYKFVKRKKKRKAPAAPFDDDEKEDGASGTTAAAAAAAASGEEIIGSRLSVSDDEEEEEEGEEGDCGKEEQEKEQEEEEEEDVSIDDDRADGNKENAPPESPAPLLDGHVIKQARQAEAARLREEQVAKLLGAEYESESSAAADDDDDDNVRQKKILAARTKLFELLEDGDGYDSKYALVPLPSFMAESEETVQLWLDLSFDQTEKENLASAILGSITDYLDLMQLSMEKGALFHDKAKEKRWDPICCGTLGSIATNLEDSTSTLVEDSADYRQVKNAILYAKNSGDFDLSHLSNMGLSYLASFFLTVDVATRNHLLLLVYLAVGCSAFGFLNVSQLTDGSSPVLSTSDMSTLGYHDGDVPPNSSDLLRRFRKCFDDSSISFADKLKLRKAFSSCVDLMDSLPVAKWQEIDSIQVDGSPGSSEPSSYFGSTEGVGTTRRSRAAYVVTAVVTSALIYHHTKDWVDYGSFGNFESVVYRNSVDFNCRKGMKLMQCKVYDGKATDKYMQKLFTNLEELVKKAKEGRGSGKSRFSADIPVLFELSTKREIDEKLSIVGFDPDDFGVEYSDDDADSDIDAAETCNC